MSLETTRNATRQRCCQVFRIATRHPGDVIGLISLLNKGELRAEDIVAIFGKTEGNGCVNDFTRAYAVSALSTALADQIGCAPSEVSSRVAYGHVRRKLLVAPAPSSAAWSAAWLGGPIFSSPAGHQGPDGGGPIAVIARPRKHGPVDSQLGD